jgi:F-type H+-transporting ATPase subunit c
MSRRRATLALVLVTLAMASPVMAAEEGVAAGKNMWQFVGAAFAIGIAAAFGALGQARGLAAACEAIGRNPGAVGPIRITMIIGLALIESLVIYALIIAFLILGG